MGSPIQYPWGKKKKKYRTEGEREIRESQMMRGSGGDEFIKAPARVSHEWEARSQQRAPRGGPFDLTLNRARCERILNLREETEAQRWACQRRLNLREQTEPQRLKRMGVRVKILNWL